MSGKRNKRLRRVVKKEIGSQYFDLYNTLCSMPIRHRIKTAYRIFVGKKLRTK